MSSSTSAAGPPPPPRESDQTQSIPRPSEQRDAPGSDVDHTRPIPRAVPGRDPDDPPRRQSDPGSHDARFAEDPGYAEGSGYDEPLHHEGRRNPDEEGGGSLPREEDFYSGVKIGSAFFGWLIAAAMLVLISGVLSGIGASAAVATRTTAGQLVSSAESDLQTAGIIGGIVLALIVFLAFYCGGYVAGRMARFDGVRQGVAVWCWGLLMSLLLWLAIFLVGDRWDPAAMVGGLPAIDVVISPTTVTGLVAIGAAALVALLSAILGAVVGVRYHRRIDMAMMSA